MKMKILYRRRFQKQLAKLQNRQKAAVADTIILFGKNPFDPTLRNHALKGSMLGRRSIAVGFDLRIIFEEKDGYAVVVMLEVGPHETVYPHN